MCNIVFNDGLKSFGALLLVRSGINFKLLAVLSFIVALINTGNVAVASGQLYSYFRGVIYPWYICRTIASYLL